jgi:PAS domain S-box-containing protein
VRLAAIVESSEDAIISKTLDGVIESWNAAAERLFGYTADEAIGKPVTLLIPPDLLDEETYILTRLRAGERIEHFETVRLAKSGRRLDISLTISPVKDRAGRIVGVSKIARDIGETRRAREALREAARRKDEFIALLSHELRNPLAPIRNGLQFLKLQPTNVGAVAQVRDIMERQLGHLVRLVDDLLDASRIGQSRCAAAQRVTLAEIVTTRSRPCRPAIRARATSSPSRCPATPVYLDADLTRIAQVLGNLLSNSAKYTDAWRAHRADRHAGRRTVAISVADKGIGIPAEDLPRVFDMFGQVEARDRAFGRRLGIDSRW